jgi:hypothetical protein
MVALSDEAAKGKVAGRKNNFTATASRGPATGSYRWCDIEAGPTPTTNIAANSAKTQAQNN